MHQHISVRRRTAGRAEEERYAAGALVREQRKEPTAPVGMTVGTRDYAGQVGARGAYTRRCRKRGRMVPLTSKHGIGATWRLALRGRLRLLLAPRCGCNRVIRRTIGDALERIRDAGQLERNLVGSAGPLQHDDPFSTEVKRSPEQQSRHNRHENHDQVVARDGDASAGESNQVVREQSFPPGLGLKVCWLAAGCKQGWVTASRTNA